VNVYLNHTSVNPESSRYVTAEISHKAVCGDGVCDNSEVQLYLEPATESTCVHDCPYVARSCPYPGSLAVSDPLQVGHPSLHSEYLQLPAILLHASADLV
jgi:hypothetical protein